MLDKFKINYQIILWILVIILCVTYGNVNSHEGKIVGGSSVSIYQIKYQASLRLKAKEKSVGFGGGHICGGSVIAQRLILTAAHCVQGYKPKDLTVVMGNDNRFFSNPQQLQYNVQKIIKYPGYNSTTYINDIALLFINGYIPWNWPTVESIRLNTQQTAINTLCTISGWGEEGNGKLSMNLLSASVPIIPYQQCYISYGFIPHSMICAGYIMFGGVDACKGDSGGPFVCNGLLTGVVSWGEGCALAFKPGVYTNVSAFSNWIVKTNSSLNYTSYDGATALSLNICLCILMILKFFYL